MWRRWFIAAGAPKLAPATGPHLSYTLTIDAAIAGQGIALVHEVLVQDELAKRRLGESIRCCAGGRQLLAGLARPRAASQGGRRVSRLAAGGVGGIAVKDNTVGRRGISLLRRIFQDVFGGIPVRFTSAYPLQESIDRLQSRTKKQPFRGLFEPSAVGRVSERKVRLQKVMPFFGNSFKPVFRGKFRQEANAVILEGKFTIHFHQGLHGLLVRIRSFVASSDRCHVAWHGTQA